MKTNAVRLLDLFKYFRQLPHQSAALVELEEAINRANPHILGRDQQWFATWSAAGKQSDLTAALKLIQEFESCHLDAYRCPAGVWTIGWGSTRYSDGRQVKQGDKINRVEADMMLRQEVDRIARELGRTIPAWREMTDEQQSALVSFAYNLGVNFYNGPNFTTITARLRDKEWEKVPDAMLLYRNPGSSFEAGLRRRREAEGRLWLQGLGLPPVQQQRPQGSVLLKVPYEYQNDNASGTGYRECFSSSAAMVARFYNKIANDDAYNKIRAKFGDTTNATAQIKALNSLGIKAQFRTNGNVALLERELNAGRPVMVGWLHQGPVSAPRGGGHWTVVIGYTSTHFIHNDPNGEASLVSGGYVNHSKGAGISYNRKNWLPRWLPDGPNSGWCITVG